MMERLNKVLARAGVASRRAADRLIEEGRVTVNGSVVGELGVRVDPARDAIKVDGKRIPAAPEQFSYWLLNKPRGCVTTMSDPEGRPTVADYVRRTGRRLFPVGRLDFNSEGLVLLTDDGDLARDLMHPASKVEKTYAVKVRGNPEQAALNRLRRGVRLEDGTSMPAGVKRVGGGSTSWLEVTVVEGRKHQVRRMLQAVGHPVLKLRRIRYGGIRLGNLAPGTLRPLDPPEVARLRRATRKRGSRGPARRGAGPS